jgi:hypothetical protein
LEEESAKAWKVFEQGRHNFMWGRYSVDLQSDQTGSQRYQRTDAAKRTEGLAIIELCLFDLGKRTKLGFETHESFDANKPDLPDMLGYTKTVRFEGFSPPLEAGLFLEYDEFEEVFLGSVDPSAGYC